MSDPIADYDALEAINTKRTAAGLSPFMELKEAEAWDESQKDEQARAEEAAKQAELKVEAEKKPEDEKTDEAIDEESIPTPKRKSDTTVETDNGELEQLRKEVQRLKSEAGRSTVLSNEMKALKARTEEAERRAAEAEQKVEQAALTAGGDALMALLSPEERAALGEDPYTVSALQKIVKRAVGDYQSAVDTKLTAAEQRIAEREQRENDMADAQAKAMRSVMWKEIGKTIPTSVYSKFNTNPKWAEWLQHQYAGLTYSDHFANALSSVDGEAVIDLLQKFMRYAGIETTTKGNPPPLKPTEQKGGSQPLKYDPEVFYANDIQRIEDGWVMGRLPEGWTQNQFDAWAKRVDQARADGRIKVGSAPR